MRAVSGVLLLALASCAAPGRQGLSLGDPESRHERVLDRLAGEAGSGRADPEAERRFEQLLLPKRPELVEGMIDHRPPGDVYAEPPRKTDTGLYAHPIP